MQASNTLEWPKVSTPQLRDLFNQIDDGRITGFHMEAFLKRSNPFEIRAHNWRVWRSVTLGASINRPCDFRRAMRRAGMRVAVARGMDIMCRPGFAPSSRRRSLDLVNVSVRELGFDGGAKRHDVLARALETGLGVCPAEAGPQLRLQYRDQPMGEHLVIGMEPLRSSAGYLNVFSVARDDQGSFLGVRAGDPTALSHAEDRFVFAIPRSEHN